MTAISINKKLGAGKTLAAIVGSILAAGVIGGAAAIGADALHSTAPGLHQTGLWGPAHNVAWSFENKNRKNSHGHRIRHGLW